MTALRQPRLINPEPRKRRAKRRRPLGRVLYSTLAIGGATSIVAGVGLVFPPAALVLAGLAAASLGLIGLGITVNR